MNCESRFHASFLKLKTKNFVAFNQGCGSGFVSGLDPDSVTLWIRIRIGNPDPEISLRNFSGKNALFSYFLKKIWPLKRYKIALATVLFEKDFDE
jgi:hypothetical protein